MTKKEFIKTFTKDEIIDTLFSHWNFKGVAMDICLYLFEKKSKRLLNDMNESTRGDSLEEFLEKHAEWEKLDQQLNTLHKNFGNMEE